MFCNNVNTKSNAVETIVKHELTHFAEGTKAYNTYADFVLREINSNPLMSERFGNLIEKIKQTENLYENLTQGKELNKQQYEVLTEVVAQYTSENLFTNEDQITRLARNDRNFFQKIIDWIKDKIEYFNKKKNLSKDEKEVLDFLHKAEKLYSKALNKAGLGYVTDKTMAQNVDKSEDKSYSLKKLNILYQNKNMQSYHKNLQERMETNQNPQNMLIQMKTFIL